jgi:hypothetical protein
MTLVEAGTRKLNYILVPKRGSNLAKYVLGHLDNTLCNVKCSTYEIDERCHVIMTTKKPIKKGDVLYYNYGNFYPMEKFDCIDKIRTSKSDSDPADAVMIFCFQLNKIIIFKL